MFNELLSECNPCFTCKKGSFRRTGHFSITQVTRPLQLVYIDIIGGLESLGGARKYVQLAVDAYSRYVWAICTSKKTANDMVHLTRLVVEKGQVELVRTDNNAAFKNRTYRKFLMANGIRLIVRL